MEASSGQALATVQNLIQHQIWGEEPLMGPPLLVLALALSEGKVSFEY